MRVPSNRTLRLIAVSYVIKTLLFVTAWLFVPDLPDRISAGVQTAWSGLGSTGQD